MSKSESFSSAYGCVVSTVPQGKTESYEKTRRERERERGRGRGERDRQTETDRQREEGPRTSIAIAQST